jgi:hypothetical protein
VSGWSPIGTSPVLAAATSMPAGRGPEPGRQLASVDMPPARGLPSATQTRRYEARAMIYLSDGPEHLPGLRGVV